MLVGGITEGRSLFDVRTASEAVQMQFSSRVTPANPFHEFHADLNSNNKSISIVSWLQVTLFKGSDTKKI